MDETKVVHKNYNILYTGNRRVLKGILLSILSILRFNESTPLIFHIFTMKTDLPSGLGEPIHSHDAFVIEGIAKRYNKLNRVKLYDLTDDFRQNFENNPNNKSIKSSYSMLKLFALKHIKTNYLLYLDVDTMINKSVSSIFDINIEEFEFAAVLDYLGKTWINHTYINSGVMYINLKVCKKTCFFDKAIELLHEKKFYLSDQSAINNTKILTKYLPTEYNEQRVFNEEYTHIYHFTKGIKWTPIMRVYNIKQWDIDKVHSVLKIDGFDAVYNEYDKLQQVIRFSF